MSNIGDLTITAISYICAKNIYRGIHVLFIHAFHVQPRTLSTMINPHPIYVAYLKYGAGHYDTAVRIEESGKDPSEELPSTSTDINLSHEQSGNCGRKSDNSQSCVFSLSRYSCRCPCYNSKRSCKAKCRCKNCSNPLILV